MGRANVAPMDLRSRLPMATRLARIRLRGERLPIAARFILTEACPSRCAYCEYGERAPGELDTAAWMRLVDATAALGVRRLCFSGGEPTVRRDLLELVDHALARGLEVELNTSGALIDRHPGLLSRLSLLKVSLDGPAEVHDRVRGRAGSHDEALAAARAGVAAGTRTVLVATVTAHNVDVIEYVAEQAAALGALCCFQPVQDDGWGRVDARAPHGHPGLAPDPARLALALDRIDAGIQSGRYRSRHSAAGLAHARRSPDFPALRCWAGHTFFIVHPDGTLVHCDRSSTPAPRIPVLDGDLAGALARAGEVHCRGCAFSGATELNLLLAGRVSVPPALVRLAGGAR